MSHGAAVQTKATVTMDCNTGAPSIKMLHGESVGAADPLKSDDLSSTWQRRDPLKQPFASSSIWNLPLGAGAQYRPMQLEPMAWEGSRDEGRLVPLTEAQLAAKGYGFGIGVDGDIIVMTPDAPLTDVLYSPAAFHCRTWGPCPECIGRGGSQPNHGPNCTGNLSRCNGGQPGHGRCADNSGEFSRRDCTPNGTALFFRAPMPRDFLWPNDGSNAGLAILLDDGRTIVQGQPFARCAVGGPGTVFDGPPAVPPQDLFGQGFYGAHGGSGLSSVGGTIRLGEMMPGAPPTRHGEWRQAQHPASLLFSSSLVAAGSSQD